MEIRSERVEIAVNGGVMGGYLAQPAEAGTRPGVLVWMEIFGVNAHIRDVTERVAREGYAALAPDFFHRTLPGIELGYDDAGMAKGMEGLGALDAGEMIADARAALAFLRGRPGVAHKVGAMGFCIGGHMAYLTACETDVAATASFYGGGIAAPQGPGGKDSTVGRSGKIAGRILCLFGGQDSMIPADQVSAVRAALAEVNARHEVAVYDDADHGFFCDQRASYNPAAAQDAWQKVKALFAAELG
ncbi:MAG: dienelactone hydrolase family protein [Deltaproteobacteria bacterium]|nr:dienelactone hydrolase family protein [Deltaproteobacteria bacterium]